MTRAGSGGGFSLIELMITIAVLGLLVLLGMPSYRVWIANSRVRTTAESIQNGLRLARNQAVDMGQRVRFELTADRSVNWTVCVPATATGACDGISTPCQDATRTNCLLQRYVNAAAAYDVALGTSSGNGGALSTPLGSVTVRGVTFDPFGRATDYGGKALGRVDISSGAAGTRRLIDLVGANGAVRQCDANLHLGTDTPEGCS